MSTLVEEGTLTAEIAEREPAEVIEAIDAHARTKRVDDEELASHLSRAVSGDPAAVEWVRARGDEHAAAARALRDVVQAADRANLIAVADAAPLIGVDLVTLMRRIEARAVSYSLPRGARGPLYLRIEDLDRLR